MFKKSSKTTKSTDSSAQSTDLSHRAKSRLQKIIGCQDETIQSSSSNVTYNDPNEGMAKPQNASCQPSLNGKSQNNTVNTINTVNTAYTTHNAVSTLSKTNHAAQDSILDSFSGNTQPLNAEQLASLNKLSEDVPLSKEELFDKILKESPVQIDEDSSAETLINDESSDKVLNLDSKDSNLQSSSKIYPVVVYTAQELAQAQKSGAERILVKGQLASKLDTALKAIKNMSASTLNALALVLSGAALLAPFTGGVSLGAAGTVMGTLGAAVTAAAIAAISAIGLSLVIAVVKGYDEVKISGGGLELVIKKHQNKKDIKVQMASDKSEAKQQTDAD